MNFVYRKWKKFCVGLREAGFQSLRADQINGSTANYIVLKHDVETNVKRAYDIACIEHEAGHCGSYYVQAYLLKQDRNIALLQKMQEMGHEISYHYDVMDSCKGNLDLAIEEFEKNKILFESCGFLLRTVCQHGNPIVERVGYTSNRDFFRSERVRNLYPDISDIMVNYKRDRATEYQYFSDAGRCFKCIYDPINNDVVDTSEKDIAYSDLDELLCYLGTEGHYMVSIHPHRWTKSSLLYIMKACLFRCVRLGAKLAVKVPFMKKIMNKYYYLAKKI
jgi:hypothetical protein